MDWLKKWKEWALSKITLKEIGVKDIATCIVLIAICLLDSRIADMEADLKQLEHDIKPQ
jgi:hypothetical protein